MRRLSNSIKRLSNNLGFGKGSNSERGPIIDEDIAEELVLDDNTDSENLDLARLQESASESEIEETGQEGGASDDEEEEQESEQEGEEDVPLSDVEVDDDADVVPHQKTTINNQKALRQALASIELPKSAKDNFYEHLSVIMAEPLVIKDIYDDTQRELAFYKQALSAANSARSELKKLKIPFSRPTDYFAEMVKSDEHMDKLKKKLVDEETAKRASQEARRQRELKKFGKKVQHAKLQDRQKEKRDTLDKIKSLKRKRTSQDMSADQFDVEIEDALKDKKEARNDKYKLGQNSKREAKNKKYGFGGKKRGSGRNTAESSMDMSGFQNSKKPGRPGKAKRHRAK